MSLRTRLALTASAAVALAVVLASAIVYFIVRNELYSPINDGLRTAVPQQVHNLQGSWQPIPGSPHEHLLVGPGSGGPAGGGPFALPWRLILANGDTYYPTTASVLAFRDVVVTARARDVVKTGTGSYFFDTRIYTQNGENAPVRVYTTRLLSAPGYPPVAIQIAGSTQDAKRALDKIRLWLLLVAFGGAALASVAGFFVAQAALRPVRELSATAEEVRRTRDLTKRIDVTGSDELSKLAATFNGMLESLDDAARQQRQLVQDASHELRTPLTSLRTNIELLAMDAGIPEDERKHMLSDVVAQLGEMTAIVGELTELARGEEQRQVYEEVRVDLIAEDAIKRTTRNHPDTQIESELERTTVVGVPASLERAFANLLDNAAKWNPPDRPIEVTLQRGVLTVRDHGPGIAPEDLPHVFDRFYRATNARSMPGSGLGLAIVKQVAEAHGGQITAERAPDGGTIMRFQLGASVTSPTPELLASS
jgi:two-component system, OmpR family, sensor histidine kinase MprB